MAETTALRSLSSPILSLLCAAADCSRAGRSEMPRARAQAREHGDDASSSARRGVCVERARVFVPYDELKKLHSSSSSTARFPLFGRVKFDESSQSVDIEIVDTMEASDDVVECGALELVDGRVTSKAPPRTIGGVFVSLTVGKAWSSAPRAVAHVQTDARQSVHSSLDATVILRDSSDVAASRGLDDSACSSSTSVTVVSSVLAWRFIPSLGSEPRWGGGFTRRSVCDVFASPNVLRDRLQLLLSSTKSGRRRHRRRWFQFACDVALGVVLARCIDVYGDEACTFLREKWYGRNYLVAMSTIESNAAWISTGKPLGMKLHVPCARIMGETAKTFVRALNQSSKIFSDGLSFDVFRVCLRLVRACGFFGVSLALAFLADVSTIFSIHLAALHVYSSLFITLQISTIKYLYRRFINPVVSQQEQQRPRTVEEVVIGTLTLPTLVLLFPTVFFFFASYLIMHGASIAGRLALVVIVSVILCFPLDDVLLSLRNPRAFVVSGAVENKTTLSVRRIDGEDFAYIQQRCVTTSEIVTEFVKDFNAWIGGYGNAALQALKTCGRLPIAVVPLQLHIRNKV